MKKLNKIVLSKAKIMTAPEMKYITGGYDIGDDDGSGTCGWYAWTGDQYVGDCGVTKSEALEMFHWWNTSDKAWCCDSCIHTDYCGTV